MRKSRDSKKSAEVHGNSEKPQGKPAVLDDEFEESVRKWRNLPKKMQDRLLAPVIASLGTGGP